MIYLDHAATTPVDPEVLSAMEPFFSVEFGNPSSRYAAGRAAAEALSDARDTVAACIGCSAEEVYFVSGGTEADNWALRGVYGALGGHIVLSAIEHPALLSCARDLEKRGASVTYVYPDATGAVSRGAVEEALRPDTCFVGVMAANNETGVVQPSAEIGRMCASRGIFYLCDCVQSAGALPLDASSCDGLSISAHKIYGPKGVGVLYLRKGARVDRLIAGGAQERNMRGGTVNVAGAVGCAKALEIAVRDRERNCGKVLALRERFLSRVLSGIEGSELNGDRAMRLPANANVAFPGCTGDQILMALDMRGIAVSTGSACAAGASSPSHVLTAMGLDEARVRSSVRFTFGKDNTEEETDAAAEELARVVESIRASASRLGGNA